MDNEDILNQLIGIVSVLLPDNQKAKQSQLFQVYMKLIDHICTCDIAEYEKKDLGNACQTAWSEIDLQQCATNKEIIDQFRDGLISELNSNDNRPRVV